MIWKAARRWQRRALLRRGSFAVGAAAIVFVAVAAVLLFVKWPFRRQSVIFALEKTLSSQVRIEGLYETFFPVPGYVAEGVIISRPSGAESVRIASIDRLVCSGSWLAILTFTHHISSMHLESLHIWIPQKFPAPVHVSGKRVETDVSELVAEHTVLEVLPHIPGGHPLRFEIPQLLLKNVSRTKPMQFRGILYNPEPPARIATQGTFGPWDDAQKERTYISGSYQVSQMDLGHVHGIAGLVSGGGTFHGTLGNIGVQGHVFTPNFEVTSSHHSVGVTAECNAIVDGLHGNVLFHSLSAHWMQSTLYAYGAISGRDRKTLVLDIQSSNARVEDLLRLFVRRSDPPLEGPIQFQAHAVLPPQRTPFLRRIRLDGAFRIREAKFAQTSSQEKVDRLSARSRGEKKKRRALVTSTWNADVSLRNGTAIFPSASFRVPGAVATLKGKYYLLSERISLHGRLHIQAKLSQAAGGIRSILLKPVDPWFETSRWGAVIPIRITGTYAHPVFKLSLRNAK